MWEDLYIVPREDTVDRHFRTSLSTLWHEAQRYIWWWLASILAGVLALGLEVTIETPLPRDFWLWLIALGFVLAPTGAFHFMRVDRDKYSTLWGEKKILMGSLRELEDLRAEGAALQIEGQTLSESSYADWKGREDVWTKRCIEVATAIHPAEGGAVETLGIFDPQLTIGTQVINLQHQQDMLNLVRRLNVLVEVRDRWSGC